MQQQQNVMSNELQKAIDKLELESFKEEYMLNATKRKNISLEKDENGNFLNEILN